MYITQHARGRLEARLGGEFRNVEHMLENLFGEPGTVAFIVARLPFAVQADDGSNGAVVVAVAVDGSVETVYFRRDSQDLSAGFFGASRVVDFTGQEHQS